MVESSSSNEHKKASFLTASTLHSGDWLLALPFTAYMDSVWMMRRLELQSHSVYAGYKGDEQPLNI